LPIILKKKNLVIFFSRKTALTRFLCSALFLTKFWLMYFCVISLSILIWCCCYVVGLCQHTWSTMVTVLLQRPLLRVQGSLLQRRWHQSKTDKVSFNLSTENRRKKWYMCSVYLLPLSNVFYIHFSSNRSYAAHFEIPDMWCRHYFLQAVTAFFHVQFKSLILEAEKRMGKVESVIKRNIFECLHVYQC